MRRTQSKTKGNVNKIIKVHPVRRMNVNFTLETLESGWKTTEETNICFPIDVKMLKCRLYSWCIGRVIKSIKVHHWGAWMCSVIHIETWLLDDVVDVITYKQTRHLVVVGMLIKWLKWEGFLLWGAWMCSGLLTTKRVNTMDEVHPLGRLNVLSIIHWNLTTSWYNLYTNLTF